MHDDLESAAASYASSLRMREGVSRAAEQQLHVRLEKLRDELGDQPVVERELAALLVELLVTSWASAPDYPDGERGDVEESVASVGEAVMAVLAPGEVTPRSRLVR